jgi:beta-galactosidase
VTTPQVDPAGATVAVRTRLENDHTLARRAVLRTTVLDGEGHEVAVAETPFALKAGERVELAQQLDVAWPRLWSVDAPSLYVLRSEVLEGRRAADQTRTTFGIRTIAYDRDEGFLLNGRRVKMNGVNLHHDGGAVGAAVPERIWEARVETLKAMGAPEAVPAAR